MNVRRVSLAQKDEGEIKLLPEIPHFERKFTPEQS